MRIMPKAKSRRIEFIQTHYPVWAANAAAIGTTPAEVAALQTLTTAAREALATQQKAQQEAQAATLALHQAVAAMNTAGRGIIGQIKAKAIVCGDEVYALANLSTPATPKANTELGTPTHISISLDQSGGLKLMWKCRNPRSAGGVVYEIWRRNTLDGEFVYLGVRGEKTFVDTSIPPGTSHVTYQIRAVRSTGVGPWVQYNVNFGTSGSGMPTTIITSKRPIRTAA